jgi:HAD superfamily hydrolase (TIGR01509 family)
MKNVRAVESWATGTKPIEGAVLCLDRLGLTGKVTPEDFVAQYEACMKKNYHKIALMPGAERLIKHLSSKNIPIAIATGSSQSGFERKTSHLGDILRKPFNHHVYAGSDPEVKNGKPHPDVFLTAAKRFPQPPKDMKNVLVFEDAINGVKAALAAGMQVILVPDKRIDLSHIKIEPTQTLDSLNDFKPELYGLPPFLDSS